MEQLGISAIERDEVNNKLIVYITEPDNIKIAKVQKNAPYDFIEFKPMEIELVFHETSALNGSKVVAGNYSFTLGLGAKKDDGTIGYIGPGHTSAPEDTDVTLNGNTLGVLEEKVHGGSADACFIRKTGTTYKPSKFLTTPLNTSFRDVFTLYSYPQNSTVYMWGQKSGNTTGTILSSNFTVTIDGVTLTNCVKADYKGASGDSGGPVCYKKYTTAPFFSVIGNHSAGPAQWIPGTSYCVFSKILYNLDAVDCTLYP